MWMAGNHLALQPIYQNWKEVFGSKPTTTSGKEKPSLFQLPVGFITQLCETGQHVLSRLLAGLKPIPSLPAVFLPFLPPL